MANTENQKRYDSRDTTELQKSGPLKGRASFHSGLTSHLSLNEASLSDAGFYECRVDYLTAPSTTTLLKVFVVEPPTNLLIKDDDGRTLSFTGEATLGHTLHLTCVANEGFPRPTVWWTLNEIVMDNSWEEENEGVTTNHLSFPLLERNLHHSKLGCHASNTNNTDPLHQYITLILNLPPLEVSISSLPSELHTGRKYRALCTISGSRPAPIVIWYIKPFEGSQRELEKQDLSERNQSHSWIELKVDSEMNGATLICAAYSPSLANVVISNETTLNVVFAPSLQLALGTTLQANAIREGMDVYFKCSIHSNPPVGTIEWLINDTPVLHNPSNNVVVSNDHLVLQKISRKWTGKYTCRAANTIGAATSQTLLIVVQYAPVCDVVGLVIRAALGQSVSVPCRVTANPNNVTFIWTFSNSVTQGLNLSVSNFSWSGLESRLSYQPNQAEDYGSLECWAKNVIGKQVTPCKVNIKPAGSPPPPNNCSVSSQTWDSLEVSCGDKRESDFFFANQNEEEVRGTQEKQVAHTQEGGGSEFNLSHSKEISIDADDSQYLLTVRKRIGKTLVYNITGKSNIFSISGLTPGLDYVITISRFNSHGRSAEVKLEALTLRTAENRMRKKKETSDQTILGIIVGSLLLLIVIGSLILLLALRGRNLRSNNHDDDTLRAQKIEDESCESYRAIDFTKKDTEQKVNSEKTLLLAESCSTIKTKMSEHRRDAHRPDILGMQSTMESSSSYSPSSSQKDHKEREPRIEIQRFFHKDFSPLSPNSQITQGILHSPPPLTQFVTSPVLQSARESTSRSLPAAPSTGVATISSLETMSGSPTPSNVNLSNQIGYTDKHFYIRPGGKSCPERESFL